VLLPDKHIRLSESILGLAGLTLATLRRRMTFDILWNRVSYELDSATWPAAHGVDNFSLALGFLFAIGAIDVSPDGEIFRCNS
jgi:hypothetical protein